MAGMEGLRSFADHREDRNAGKVMNGSVIPMGVREYIDASLTKFNPDVVILGNSLSNTDIVPPQLARALGVGKRKVQKFSVPNSIGAHWYAILKNRVYANGHAPALVIIHSDMQSLLAVTPRSEASYLNLSVHLDEREPVFDDKLGARLWFLERIRENRGRVRDQALNGARNAMVDLLVHGTLTRTDPRATERALKRVFDDDKVDMRLHRQVIPIFSRGTDRDLLPFDPETLPLAEDSFIPEIVRLVQGHGGRVFFIRPPMSPMLPAGLGDVVLPAAERDVPEIVAREGGVYIDARQVAMRVGHFYNLDHMNNEGANRFTALLADTVMELGLWRQNSRQPAVDLLRPTRVVDGFLTNVEPDVSFRSAAPRVPQASRSFQRGRGKTAAFPADAFGFLSDQVTLELTRHASRCSPLRVVEAGRALPLANATCEATQKHGAGRVCHTPEKVFFTTPDGSSPFANGRSYALALDEERRCPGARWLYPGDHMRLTLAPGALGDLPRGASTLVVAAHNMNGDGPVSLRAKVRVGNRLRADAQVSIAKGDEHDIALEPRIHTGVQNTHIDLINDKEHFVLVTEIRLENR